MYLFAGSIVESHRPHIVAVLVCRDCGWGSVERAGKPGGLHDSADDIGPCGEGAVRPALRGLSFASQFFTSDQQDARILERIEFSTGTLSGRLKTLSSARSAERCNSMNRERRRQSDVLVKLFPVTKTVTLFGAATSLLPPRRRSFHVGELVSLSSDVLSIRPLSCYRERVRSGPRGSWRLSACAFRHRHQPFPLSGDGPGRARWRRLRTLYRPRLQRSSSR